MDWLCSSVCGPLGILQGECGMRASSLCTGAVWMDDMGLHHHADAHMQQYEPNMMTMVSMQNEHAACCCRLWC